MRQLMRTILLVAGLVALLASPAMAQKRSSVQDIDFSQITCGDFVEDLQTANAEDVGVILMWLDGYLSGVSGDTVLRWDGMKEFGDNLVQLCKQKPRMKVLDASEEVGIE